MKPSSFIRHESGLVTAAAVLYILHIHLIVKIALLELTAFWSIFFFCWAVARREARISWHILYFPLFLYGLVSTVSALTAPQRTHMYGEGMLWFKMLIFPFVISIYRELPRLRELAIYAYGVVAAGGSIWGLIEYGMRDRNELENRINGPSSHVMTYSGILLPLSLMMLVLWWRERRWWQLVACALSTLTLLLTFTRGVWLGWLVAVVVLLLTVRARLVFYAVPAALIFITFLPLPFFARVISTFDTSPRESSNFDRIRMVQAGVEMIKDFPLLGVGPANVKEVYSIYRKHDAPRPRPPHLHNNVVQLWAERGILALTAYVMLLALFLRECLRAWRSRARMWAEVGLVVAVSLTVAGLFEFNFGDTEVFYMLLNLMALVVVSIERTEPGLNAGAGMAVPSETSPVAC